MTPVVFRFPDWIPLLGEQAVTSFGMALLIAFLAGGWIFVARLEASSTGPGEAAWEMVILAAIAGIGGAKLHYLLLDALGLGYPVPTPGVRSGLSWYGGFVSGALAVAWRARVAGLPLGLVADAAAPALALGYALGRTGSFFVGADYGLPTTGPMGIPFPRGAPPTTVTNMSLHFDVFAPTGSTVANYVRVHPTQLYEAALSLLIAGLLVARRPAGGRVFGLYLALANGARLGVEMLRAKTDRLFGPVTLDFLIAASMVLAGAAVILRTGSRDRPARGERRRLVGRGP